MRTDNKTQRLYVPIDKIIEGDRVRQDYGDLQDLADSIKSEGLIHPVVIDLNYTLVAGGRRFRAHRDILKAPEIAVTFIETLDDSHLRRLEAEENVRRKEMTWQERVRSVKIVHQTQVLKNALAGSAWTQRMTGDLLGYSQAHTSYALTIATCLEKGDKEINDCDSFSDAIKKLTERLENEVNASIAKATIPGSKISQGEAGQLNRTIQDILASNDTSVFTEDRQPLGGPPVGLSARPDTPEVPLGSAEVPPLVVPISSMLYRGDCITWMDQQPTASFDHIITDPPYAIDMDNIQQSGMGMNIDSTRNEHNVQDNISLLKRFFEPATRILKDKGYLILWCDISQWGLLCTMAEISGLAYQRWPLIWSKTHPCQNGAAQYNFTKNFEIAFVARKGNATLLSTQSSSIWQGSGLAEKDLFGHPFAKPTNLWKWLLGAVAIKGQRVLDPFVGSGSSTIAAIQSGLSPVGVECNESHYNRLVVNVSNVYKSMHPNVQFT